MLSLLDFALMVVKSHPNGHGTSIKDPLVAMNC